MPASAGMTVARHAAFVSVTPADAGAHPDGCWRKYAGWMPADAGMTQSANTTPVRASANPWFSHCTVSKE